MFSKFTFFLTGAVLLAILAMAWPELGMIAMVTIIGIPLAFAYWAIPALVVVFLITFVIHRVLSRKSILISLLICAALLMGPVVFLNHKIDQNVQTYLTDDRNNLELPLTVSTVAVRRKFRFGRDQTRCDGFCLHALLTGAAERILYVPTNDFTRSFSPEDEALAFSLERQDHCPSVNLLSRRFRAEAPLDGRINYAAPTAAEEMRFRIASGECLISRKVRLGEADLILTYGPIKERTQSRRAAAFSLSTNAASASRITVHQKDSTNQAFHEQYRRTNVHYEEFAYALLPSPVATAEFNVWMGFPRVERHVNAAGEYSNSGVWERFVTTQLGLDLSLDSSSAIIKARSFLLDMVESKRDPTQQEWQVVDDTLSRLLRPQKEPIADGDIALAMQYLHNPRFPVVNGSYRIAHYAARSKNEALQMEIAQIGFGRLKAGKTWSDTLGVSNNDQIWRVSSVLAELPDSVFLPYYDQMLSLSQEVSFQDYGGRVLRKLYLFKEKAVPTLLYLIDIGLSGSPRSKIFQEPYIAGLSGFCMGAPETNGGLKRLLELMEQGKLPIYGSYGELLMDTLIRMDADPDVIWPLYSARNSNATRQDLLQKIGNKDGAWRSWDCGY